MKFSKGFGAAADHGKVDDWVKAHYHSCITDECSSAKCLECYEGKGKYYTKEVNT